MEDTSKKPEDVAIYRCSFVVNETPYCLWGNELPTENIAFLRQIDPGYFAHVAELNLPLLDGDSKDLAAASIRLAYTHGLETLFALLCSIVQAPQCTLGWLTKYKPHELMKLITKIQCYRPFFAVDVIDPVGWDGIANVIFSTAVDRELARVGAERFAGLWSMFAAYYIEDNHTLEYNAMKHGLRAGPGGLQIAMGLEPEPGVAPARMYSMGSRFGSRFYVADELMPKDKVNWQVHRRIVNWNPKSLAVALSLISVSIENIVSFLLWYNKARDRPLQFTIPSEEDFAAPFRGTPSVASSGGPEPLDASLLPLLSGADVLKDYKRLDRRR